MKSLREIFLKKYPNASESDRELVVALSYVLLVASAVTLPLPFFMSEPVTRIFVIVLCAVFITLLALAYSGRARRVGLATPPLICALLSGNVFALPFAQSYEIYMLAAFVLFSMIISIFVSREARLSLVCMGIGSVALIIEFVIRSYPLSRALSFRAAPDDLIITLVIGWFCALIGYSLVRRNNTLLANAEAEGRRNAEQVAKMERAISASRDSLNLSARLNESSRSTSDLVLEMLSSMDKAKADMSTIDDKTKRLAASLAEIKDGSGAVRANSEGQSSIVTQTSSAIEEMTASIRSMSSVTVNRRGEIERLEKSTEEGRSEMVSVSESVKVMDDHAAAILGIVNVINGVAARTNLLAMNAAGRAARASPSWPRKSAAWPRKPPRTREPLARGWKSSSRTWARPPRRTR